MAKKQTTEQQSEKKHVARNCSFCGRSSDIVYRLIAGPGDINICDDCVSVCQKILHEETGSFICPLTYPKISRMMEDLGSQLILSPNLRTKSKYDVLYLYPDNPLSKKIYSTCVLPLADKYKLKIRTFADIKNMKDSFDREILDIYNASLVIADVHGKDPDIMYLLGMIHIIGKPIVTLFQDSKDNPSGYHRGRYIFYDNKASTLPQISSTIQPIFQSIYKIKKLTKNINKRK